MTKLPTVDRPAVFLEENGILFEINRQVLHPLGLELHLTCGEGGELARLELLDNRSRQGPIVFSPEAFEEGREQYQRYMAEHGKRNIQKRRQIGMVIQTGPNLPYHIHDGGTTAEP